MDLKFYAFLLFSMLMIISVITMLVYLSKKSDERYTYIKAKVMSNTLYFAVFIIIIRIATTICNAFTSGDMTLIQDVLDEMSLLITISLVFLISYIWNKRKYGG